MEIWLKIVLTSWSDKINPMKSREKMSLMFYTNCIHFLWHYNKSQETQRLKTTKTGYLPVSRSKVWQGPHQPEIRAVAYSHLGCCMENLLPFLSSGRFSTGMCSRKWPEWRQTLQLIIWRTFEAIQTDQLREGPFSRLWRAGHRSLLTI